MRQTGTDSETPSSRSPRPEILFWDVDTQMDFMLPGGKLYVPGAEQIIPNLKRLTEHARAHKILVLASTDAHQPDDPEFAQYPPHCVAGTAGQQKIPETQLAARYVVPNARAELPPDFGPFEQIIVEKQKLDVFSNPNLEELLKRLRPREVVLYGVVTELCVQCAARGLLDRGHRIRLVTDAVRELDERKGRDLIKEIVQRGGALATTEQVVGSVG
jgi:nicotinamidase/pyrazinamidase